jgi:hypothetical protein
MPAGPDDIGLVTQVVILVAQNHAPRRHMGVATSTATFARSISVSIGVAIFGAIFAARLSSELASLGPTEASADSSSRSHRQLARIASSCMPCRPYSRARAAANGTVPRPICET